MDNFCFRFFSHQARGDDQHATETAPGAYVLP